MRVLIATDAWAPQVNGVVRTLTSLARCAPQVGMEIVFLPPDGFPRFPVPSYPGLHLAIPDVQTIARRIEAARPDAIHIATEGPIGQTVRTYCLRNRLPFMMSFTTKLPECIAARFFVPTTWSYWVLRRFHAAGRVTMASTGSLVRELRGRGFHRPLGRYREREPDRPEAHREPVLSRRARGHPPAARPEASGAAVS